MEYCGEVCTTEEFVRRKKEYHKERRRHYYFMSLKSDEVSIVRMYVRRFYAFFSSHIPCLM